MTNNIVRKSINFDPKHEFNFRKSANVMNMPILLNCIDTGLFFMWLFVKEPFVNMKSLLDPTASNSDLEGTKNFLYLLIIAKG